MNTFYAVPGSMVPGETWPGEPPEPGPDLDFTYGTPYLDWTTGTPYTGRGEAPASTGTPVLIPGFSSVPGGARPAAWQPGRAGGLADAPLVEFAFGEPYISWSTGTPYI